MSLFPQSLWEFSVSVYAQPGMEPVSLWLQDQRQMNANVLLWALWLDEQHYPFQLELWQRGQSQISSWQRCWVMPLRWLRRRLPKRRPWLRLRRRVQHWELWGERRQLQRLQAVSEGFDFTRDGGGKETAEIQKVTAPAGYTGYLLRDESGAYRAVQSIMSGWRQPGGEVSR